VPAAYHQDEAAEAAWGRWGGDALPAALARRAARGARLATARRRLEAEAQADAAAEHERRAAADAARRRTGQKRRGQGPQPRVETPDDKAQRRLTAPARPRMPRPNPGWGDCGTAPARVDGACQRILACDGTDATKDKQPAAPLALAPLATLAPAGLERPKDAAGEGQGSPATLANGSDSATAVQALEDLGVDPSRAPGHPQPPGPEAEASDAPTTPKERRAATVRTPAGKAG
jgi:hypothetical protein